MVAIIGIAILSGYGAALWWLLRRESPWVFVALTGLCGASLALRLVLTGAYPWGLAEDEPKVLGCAVQAVERGSITGESCIHIPYLLTAVFQAPLVPHIGANRWSIRSYSMLTSVLAAPALFAAARAMGMRAAPSAFAAGLVAVLPWSIYYGRIILGGELILHQALLLAGLARLVWRRGGWPDASLAGFGLCLLLWDYWAGRSMIGMPMVAAVLATGWRRMWCVAVLVIALAGWYPHLATGPADAHVGLSLRGGRGATIAGGFHAGFATAPWETAVARTRLALRTLVEPVGQESIFTMRSVAMHPPLLLALAGLGLFTGVRRGLFLLAGFVAGMAPGIASSSFAVSAHRVMMAYAFIALSAAAALDLLPWRWVRRSAAAVALAAAALWSVPFYFSPRFWPEPLRWPGEADLTALADAVAEMQPPRLIFMHQLGFYAYVASPPKEAGPLRLDNWLPADNEAVTYLFTMHGALLRPQYERLFATRVRPVGRGSFLVTFEAGDWSWFRRHGWLVEVRCGDAVRTVQVPFLFHLNFPAGDTPCAQPVTYTWRAHWSGPPTEFELAFSGSAAVEGAGVSLRREGWEQRLSFALPGDSDVAVSLTMPVGTPPAAMLYEKSPGGPRVPDWDRFTPPAAP